MISCLKFYLDLFKRLQPKYPTDMSCPGGPDGGCIATWQHKEPEQPYTVHDIGPPTWVEEQRVLLAFWRRELVNDVRAVPKSALIGWPESDIQKLGDIPLRFLWLYFHDEDFETRTLYQYHQDDFFTRELIWTAVDYTREDSQTITTPGFLQTKRNYPVPSKRDSGWKTLSDYMSATMGLFSKHVQEYAATHSAPFQRDFEHDVSPLRHVPFIPFRALGFAIWCFERMVGYRLLALDSETRDEFDYYDENQLLVRAWRSILTEEEIAETVRINQRTHEDSMRDPEVLDSDDEDLWWKWQLPQWSARDHYFANL